MQSVIEPVEEWGTTDAEQRAAVLAELEEILASSHFRISRRYPNMLRFIVEAALAGRGDELKERTIGVEVFARPLTYDTTLDPVVRVTAAEVRKRLHQYYESPKNHSKVRILLSAGSYLPHFLPVAGPESSPAVPAEEMTASSIVITPMAPATESQTHNLNKRWPLIFLLIALIAAGGVAVHHLHARQTTSAVDQFWQPLLDPSEPILLSVGPMPMLHPAPLPNTPTPEMNLLDAVYRYNIIPLSDAITLSKITSVLGQHHSPFHVLDSETTTFDQLQEGPTVLTGALNNQWTVRLTSKLRFYFEDSRDISSIRDRDAKVQPDWHLYRSKNYSNLTQDYAIVARYHDLTTGKIVVIAAGIGPNGTLAAGDFLTRSDQLKDLLKLAPANWNGNGVEAVITTEVINGKSGPPRILASQFW